jgi:hypothetical protein
MMRQVFCGFRSCSSSVEPLTSVNSPGDRIAFALDLELAGQFLVGDLGRHQALVRQPPSRVLRRNRGRISTKLTWLLRNSGSDWSVAHRSRHRTSLQADFRVVEPRAIAHRNGDAKKA